MRGRTFQLVVFVWLVAVFIPITKTTLHEDHESTRRALDKLLIPKVCYDELGCFDNTGPFFDLKKRPLQLLPQSPGWIGTKFLLHTRHAAQQRISAGPELGRSAFSPSRQTKFIIHGFVSNSEDDGWMQEMKDVLLNLDDFNVILVDWRRGALPPYTQATANTRVVGAQIAQLIQRFVGLGASAEDVHVIGHSLGAHISGYAGTKTPGLGRISGLDPADPYFQGTHPRVRLDPTDALFVDVIHTDADHIVSSTILGTGGFGTKQPSGHVDFYPNGGLNQPGCSSSELVDKTLAQGLNGFVEGTKEYLACDHLRVYKLYIDSIKSHSSCWFTAIPCETYRGFKTGKCHSCGSAGCGRMGYYADTAKPRRRGQSLVTYFLETGAETPYCLHHYFITVIVRSGQRETEGTMSIQLRGVDDGSTRLLRMHKKSVTYTADTEYRFMVASPQKVTELKAVGLQWKASGVLQVEKVVVGLVADDLTEYSTTFPLTAPLVPGRVLNTVRQ